MRIVRDRRSSKRMVSSVLDVEAVRYSRLDMKTRPKGGSMTKRFARQAVLVVSDSLGATGYEVARAACGQFDGVEIAVERLTKVNDADVVEKAVRQLLGEGSVLSVLYTIADGALRAEVGERLRAMGVNGVDVLGPAVQALSESSGVEPSGIAGSIHRTDEEYFKRIEAMEYFVEHDDGRGADDLDDADIVLIGISRTGKTPLSMYLAHLGYRVANIPLVPGVEPPASLFSVDPGKVFGLISTTEVVATIRDRRLGDDMSRAVASDYADPERVRTEMDEARALIKKLGCITVRTDGKAIEESAAEILERMRQVRIGRERRRERLDAQSI